MDVLVTGATGFIGRCVTERLVARGDRVRVLTRGVISTRPGRGGPERLPGDVEVVRGSLTDWDAVARASQGMQTVYHLAALLPGVGIQRSQLMQTNLRGTEYVLRAAALNGVQRFVFTSSVALYGPATVVAREDAPTAAHGPYGSTKLWAEELLRRYPGVDGPGFVILRLSPVYGPGAAWFERLLRQMLTNPSATAWRGGERTVQLLHLDDAADAVVLGGTAAGAQGEVFNIAGSEAVSRRFLVVLVNALARGVARRPFDRLAGDRPLKFDIGKASALLGFEPRVRLAKGLAGMLATLEDDRSRRRWLVLDWPPWASVS